MMMVLLGVLAAVGAVADVAPHGRSLKQIGALDRNLAESAGGRTGRLRMLLMYATSCQTVLCTVRCSHASVLRWQPYTGQLLWFNALNAPRAGVSTARGDGPLGAALPTAPPGLSHPFALEAPPPGGSKPNTSPGNRATPAGGSVGDQAGQQGGTAPAARPASAPAPAAGTGSSACGDAAAGMWAAAVLGALLLFAA